MRFIRTFLIRLYVDPEIPGQLCGDLRSIEEQGAIPFKDGYGLNELLRQLSRLSIEKNRQSTDAKELDA
jgi:hypothetical protein